MICEEVLVDVEEKWRVRDEEEEGREEGPISKSALFKVDDWCMRCQSTTMSNSITMCTSSLGMFVPK